jgi:Ala-tRNA(Pro) deacylase
MIPDSVCRYLHAKPVPYHVMTHSPRSTAQETAHVAHVSGRRFAKVVLVRGLVDGAFALAVLPASEEVDLSRLGDVLGQPVTLATELELNRLFPEYDPGAAPPFGELAGLPVIADACLSRETSIVFHGGTHTDLIEMRWGDFVSLVRPQVTDFGRAPQRGA